MIAGVGRNGRALRRPGSVADRLALTETLLLAEDVGECVERALAWLAEHAGVRRSACLVVEGDPARLVPVATYRLATARLGPLPVDLVSRQHPLVRALGSRRPLPLAAEARDGRNGGPVGSLVALPLRAGLVPPTENMGGSGRPQSSPALGAPRLSRGAPRSRDSFTGSERVGVLVVEPPAARGMADVHWVAAVLAPRVARSNALSRLIEAEERLDGERALLQGIINAMPDPVLLTDTEGRMRVANGRAEALLAGAEGESEGRRRAVALNNMFFSAALGRRAVEEAGTPRRELVLVDPSDGSDLLFELLSTAVNDRRHGTGIVSILRNVTDLRRATEEIEENYRKLRLAEAEARSESDRLDLIIDSVADPIVVTDPSGNTVMMNAPAERLFSVPPDVSDEILQRVRANDAHFSSFVSNVFFTAGERHRGGIALVDPRTGLTIPVEAVSGKILSGRAEITGVVTILHDLTEAVEKERLYEQLKRASAELEEKVREATAELVRRNELLSRQALQLEQASALKSQFLANMSHEFRTPLNAILGYTTMLLGGVSGELSGQQRRNLARVESNARHLLSIINEILDISRIEAGQMPVHLSAFTLPDLIAEVLAEVEPLIARANLSVGSKVAPDLPPMFTDRPKVKQIVLNLLTNAIKFTPKGSVTVVASWDTAQENVVVAVVDTGIGVPAQDREKIFEDFRQADGTPTREYGGAGLGLSISRRLAGILGGRITLDSTVGQGSTFTLVLPPKARTR